MTIELFTLCDGAYNYNGKLTIVGTLATMNPGSLPVRVKMGVAMRLRVENHETGEKDMHIRFKAPDGKYLPIDMAAKLNIIPTDDPFSYIMFAAEIQGFPIDTEGVYCSEVTIDDVVKSEYPFYVKTRKE